MNADLCAMRGNHSQTSGRAARDSVVANTAHITVTVYLIDTSWSAAADRRPAGCAAIDRYLLSAGPTAANPQ